MEAKYRFQTDSTSFPLRDILDWIEENEDARESDAALFEAERRFAVSTRQSQRISVLTGLLRQLEIAALDDSWSDAVFWTEMILRIVRHKEGRVRILEKNVEGESDEHQ